MSLDAIRDRREMCSPEHGILRRFNGPARSGANRRTLPQLRHGDRDLTVTFAEPPPEWAYRTPAGCSRLDPLRDRRQKRAASVAVIRICSIVTSMVDEPSGGSEQTRGDTVTVVLSFLVGAILIVACALTLPRLPAAAEVIGGWTVWGAFTVITLVAGWLFWQNVAKLYQLLRS